MLSALITEYPPVEDSLVASGKRAPLFDEKVELLPAEPVEVAILVVGGNDDAAAQQGHGLRRERGRGQQQFGGFPVRAPLTLLRRRAEPEVELTVGAGQTLQTIILHEVVDIGGGVGGGLINVAGGAEVQDGIHREFPFVSFFGVRSASAALLPKLPM